MRYSALKIIKEALTGHKGWKPVWRKPEPKPAYDIIIIGGGGHGLATAHYLASKFEGKNIAVLEKSWIGGGNVGRNTTIIRSNYAQRKRRVLRIFAQTLGRVRARCELQCDG